MYYLKKYNWIICFGCSIVWLIRYINVEQTLWQLSGVFTFAVLSFLLFNQSKKEKVSDLSINEKKIDYVKEAYQEEE